MLLQSELRAFLNKFRPFTAYKVSFFSSFRTQINIVKNAERTVMEKTNQPKYYVKSENQLLLCENIGWKNHSCLILKP